MKKKIIVGIVIVTIIIFGIASYFIYNKIIEEGRKYEIPKIKNYSYFVCKQESGYGVIDKLGNTLIDAKYECIIIPNPEKPVFLCYEGEKSIILNDKNEKIFQDYSGVEPIRLKNIASDLMYEKSVLVYEKEGKYGLVNLDEKQVTDAIYDIIEAMPYKEGELLVSQNEKYGVINFKGNKLIDIKYEEISIDKYFTENEGYKYAGYIVSTKTEDGYRYGYVDVNGKEILKNEYNELSRIIDMKNDDIYLAASKDGRYGVYKNANQIINNEYQSIRYEKNTNVLIVEKSKKYGALDLQGKIIIPIQYSQIDITGKYIYAKNNEEITVYDNKGNRIEESEDTFILPTENENYQIKIDNTNGARYSVVDKNNQQLTNGEYSYLEYLYGNYFIASSLKGKLGVINTNDEQKIELKYDSIEKIQNTDNLKTILSEDKSTEIFSKEFNQIAIMTNANINVEEEYIKLYNENQTLYIDKTGKEVQNTEIFANNKLFAKSRDGKWGFIDKESKIIIDFVYDKVTDFNKYGFAGIKKDGKWGVIDTEGNIILEPTYTFDSKLEPDFINRFYRVEYGYGESYFTDIK